MLNHEDEEEDVLRMRVQDQDSVLLSEDVLIELLIYLPVKSLMRFKCISKYWCDLIKCSIFVNRHLHLQRDDHGKTILVKHSIPLTNGDKDVVLSFHNPAAPDQWFASPNISSLFFSQVLDSEWVRYDSDIHGSCNGIVCFQYGCDIAFCNPALHEFRVLDACPFTSPECYCYDMYQSGFGFDTITNSYKLILFWRMDSGVDSDGNSEELIRIDLCNLSSNFWRIIDDVVLLPQFNSESEFNLLFNGSYHWNETNFDEHPIKGTILSFNFQNEVFQRFVFPCCDDDTKYPSLVVLDQCIAIIHHGRYYNELPVSDDIWIMKEYGVESSWTKEFVIGPYLFNYPFFCLRKEWLFVRTQDCQLASCALHKNDMKICHQFPKDLDAPFRALIFTESLVSMEKEFFATKKIS